MKVEVNKNVISCEYKWNSEPELRDILGSLAVETLQNIVSDNERRLNGSDKKLLIDGFFYANEYALKLIELKQFTRLESLKNNAYLIDGYVSLRHFDRIKQKSATGFKMLGYIVKKDVLPTEALKASQIGLSLLDCLSVLHIAYYDAIRKVIGDKKFNFIFSRDSKTPLRFDDGSPCRYLMKFLPLEEGKGFLKGQRVHYSNAFITGKHYQTGELEKQNIFTIKHWLCGDAAGFNVLCRDSEQGKEKYIGLGLDSKGVTHQEIKEVLRSTYNDTPLDPLLIMRKEEYLNYLESTDKVTLSLAKELENDILDPERFEKMEGGKIIQVSDFDASRIAKLAKVSDKKARELMETWAKS